MKRHPLAGVLLLTILIASFAGTAYGHGLGVDRTLPVAVGNKQVTVEAKISPASIPIDPSTMPTLTIRAYDANGNATINGVDYKILVELRNETLLDQRFKSSDGIILASLVPGKEFQKWQIAGHESAAPGDQIEVSQASPLEIRSMILTSGGLYHLTVILEKTSLGIALQSDITFDLYISVAHSLQFTVETPDGERNIVVKTYYDDVDELEYQNGTISFSMPFNWDPDYVNQVSVLHMEVQFPRTIEGLKSNSYVGSLNGITLPPGAILIDDYSSDQYRVVHFVVPNDRLSEIAKSLEKGTRTAVFVLTGAERPRFPMNLFSAPNEKYLFQLAWGPEVIETGIPTTFVMNIQDPATGDLIRGSTFDFVLTQDGSEIYKERLNSAFGTFAKDYTFSRPGTVTISANNINGGGEFANMDLIVLQGSGNPAPQQPQQPSKCLIATAAFGSELAPQVQYLRNFREQYILSTSAGSAFMKTFNSVYYSFSPQVADLEREQPYLQTAVKTGLYPLFGILMLSETAQSGAGGGEGGTILAGVTASSLIGAIYLTPLGLAARGRIRTKWIAISIGASLAFLTLTMFTLPMLLSFSTAALVVVFAGSAALIVAKVLLRIFGRT